MLTAKTIQINRYRGIDNTKVSIVHSEVETLKTLYQINKEVKNITKFNKANHINIKGFSANFHNYGRNSEHYSIAENLFREQLELNGISTYLHEYKIQIKDALLNTHTYHLDFYIPDIKLAIEISPNFHHSYETVAIRDKLRASLLKRKNNITTIEVKVCFRTKKGVIETYLDKKSVDYAIKEIKTAKKSQESLNYYL